MPSSARARACILRFSLVSQLTTRIWSTRHALSLDSPVDIELAAVAVDKVAILDGDEAGGWREMGREGGGGELLCLGVGRARCALLARARGGR